jgi:GWxTD domain-containing protein
MIVLTAAVAVLIVASISPMRQAPGPVGPTADWTTSPEALFLTRDELKAWQSLRTDDERQQFQADYWHRRDPEPETLENEFEAVVRVRIEAADEQFTIGDIPGSHTHRGRVFVLLGPPAVIRATAGPLDTAPRYEAPGRVVLPRAALGSPQWQVWVYDRTKNRDLLKVLRRPHLEIAITVGQGKQDSLENAGLFYDIREAVARSTLRRRVTKEPL